MSRTILIPLSLSKTIKNVVPASMVLIAILSISEPLTGQERNETANTEQAKANEFDDFIARVNGAESADRAAIVDSFMNAQTEFPVLYAPNTAYFIYRGNASTVSVPGDANGWNPNSFNMTKLSTTDLFYYKGTFEADARLDYKFVLNGGSWILDPLNPNKVSGGFGPNSELAMPDYVQPWEIVTNTDIPHGSLETFTFASTVLSNSRTIKVYLPPDYATETDRFYGLILFHDGLEYISLGSA